ncbi:MAG: fructose-bisphosphate aldolase [Chloroflexi bacterium]|nr:fructose-bisphosphate aldolase [Chloroflexota bacterium]MCL5075931.1 fructose-bisphosphate aldolase [Chloroflexota bacterium]
MIGKKRRLQRLLVGTDRRCLLIALDHAAWLGPVKGIDCPAFIVQKVLDGGANALLMGPGFTRAVETVLKPSTGIVLRVSLAPGLALESTQETPLATVETALRMDADAVAVSVFFGRGGETAMMRYLGELIEQCDRFGMPVLAEMMPPAEKAYDAETIAHAARIGFEVGADIVKTNYCGHVESFKQVVKAVPAPILVAGGPSNGEGEDDMLQMVREVVESGAAGVAIGRRVWQSAMPDALVRKISAILFLA